MWLLLLLLLLYPLPGDPHVPVLEFTELPAVVVVYDPVLGGINCDHDCTTVATGPLREDMYEVAGACDERLLGRSVRFEQIGLTIECVDTGGMIRPMWSDHYNQMVLYFDVLWHLEIGPNGEILGAPAWNYQLLHDWSVLG